MVFPPSYLIVKNEIWNLYSLSCYIKSISLLQWRIIAGGTKCIPKSELPLGDDDPQSQPSAPPSSRLWLHPSDLSIALSASTPLYPPGRVIHVVHNHPPETW